MPATHDQRASTSSTAALPTFPESGAFDLLRSLETTPPSSAPTRASSRSTRASVPATSAPYAASVSASGHHPFTPATAPVPARAHTAAGSGGRVRSTGGLATTVLPSLVVAGSLGQTSGGPRDPSTTASLGDGPIPAGRLGQAGDSSTPADDTATSKEDKRATAAAYAIEPAQGHPVRCQSIVIRCRPLAPTVPALGSPPFVLFR